MASPSAAPLTVDGVPVARVIELLRTRKLPSVAAELDVSVRAVQQAVLIYNQHRERVDGEIADGKDGA